MTNLPGRQPLRLREKLLTHGVKQLADIELLALFINVGTRKKSCLALAYELLQHFGDLRKLLNADIQSFKAISGIGVTRFTQIQAMREICRRVDFISLQKQIALRNSQDTCTFLKRQLRDKKHETFVDLFLDNQYRLIAYEELFQGTINAAVLHPRPLIERALQRNAAALILAHNHPSGVSDASEQDIEMTDYLRKALQMMDIELLDHLVVGDNEVYSIVSQIKWNCH